MFQRHIPVQVADARWPRAGIRGPKLKNSQPSRSRTSGIGYRPAGICDRPFRFFACALLLVGCAHQQMQTTPAPVTPTITDEDIAYFREHTLMVPVDGVDPSKVPDSF